MSKIRNLVKTVIVSFFILFFILFIIGFVFFWFDNAGFCTSNGGVWDGNEHRCRDDCLVWQKEFGCIQLTKEQSQKFEDCSNGHDNCPSEQDMINICLFNQKAWNKDEKECRFNFQPQDCYKLSGNWQYPEICAAKVGKT